VAPKIQGNPVARIFKNDLDQLGDAKEFPYAGTSYRLTEHFHFWTKHVRFNAVMQPEFFVEIPSSSPPRRASRPGIGCRCGRNAAR
jgi:formate dehydrogenase major subunit